MAKCIPVLCPLSLWVFGLSTAAIPYSMFGVGDSIRMSTCRPACTSSLTHWVWKTSLQCLVHPSLCTSNRDLHRLSARTADKPRGVCHAHMPCAEADLQLCRSFPGLGVVSLCAVECYTCEFEFWITCKAGLVEQPVEQLSFVCWHTM
jgi:hypothetical protein